MGELETPSAKFRVAQMETIKGQLYKGIMVDAKLKKEGKGQLKGREFAYMDARKFDHDAAEGQSHTEREVHDLKFEGENMHGYHIALDALLLEITDIPHKTMGIPHLKQMERSVQVQKVFKITCLIEWKMPVCVHTRC